MGVKTGYKQTEVGVIPEDWDIKILGELFTFSGGVSASREQLSNAGHCYLHYGDIHTSNKTYIDAINEATDIPRLDIDIRKVPTRSLLSDGDIVFVDASEDDDGASKHIVVRNTDNRTFISGLHTIVAKSKGDTFNNLYKEYCFQTYNIKQWFRYYAVGTKVTGISKTNIVKIPIPIPPLSEQTAIATALSDADALIQSLERLIAKKRDIKQGAMQELLTGKKRLPGFEKKKGYKQTEVGGIPEDWRVLPLSKLCKRIVDGTHFTPQYVEIGIPFYSVENVTANDFINVKFISDREHNQLIQRCKPEKGDILLTRIGSIGDTKLIDWDIEGSIYVSLALLKVNDFIDVHYLYCYSKSRQFIKGMEDRSLLNASPKKINMCEIGGVPIPVPEPSEQSAIATVLSDMDAEITAIESKLTRTRQIKQGMMQELLTGRIRLT